MTDLQSWEEDKALYLFTSLTAGSSHVITATSRIETILKNARIPFSYIDTATNESARKLFQRRGKGKKLPLLVKAGFVIADLEQVEDWNEFGELKEAIGPVATSSTSVTTTPAKAPATGASSTSGTPSKPAAEANATAGAGDTSAVSLALRKAAFESANAAKERQAASTPTITLNNTSTPSKSTAQSDSPLSPSNIPLPMSPLPPTSPTTPRSRHGSSASSLAQKQYVPEHFDPPPATHRGSSLSLASEEEIREIESKETILEEDEDEDEDEGATAAVNAPQQSGKKDAAQSSTKAGSTTETKDTEGLTQKLNKVKVGQ